MTQKRSSKAMPPPAKKQKLDWHAIIKNEQFTICTTPITIASMPLSNIFAAGQVKHAIETTADKLCKEKGYKILKFLDVQVPGVCEMIIAEQILSRVMMQVFFKQQVFERYLVPILQAHPRDCWVVFCEWQSSNVVISVPFTKANQHFSEQPISGYIVNFANEVLKILDRYPSMIVQVSKIGNFGVASLVMFEGLHQRVDLFKTSAVWMNFWLRLMCSILQTLSNAGQDIAYFVAKTMQIMPYFFESKHMLHTRKALDFLDCFSVADEYSHSVFRFLVNCFEHESRWQVDKPSVEEQSIADIEFDAWNLLSPITCGCTQCQNVVLELFRNDNVAMFNRGACISTYLCMQRGITSAIIKGNALLDLYKHDNKFLRNFFSCLDNFPNLATRQNVRVAVSCLATGDVNTLEVLGYVLNSTYTLEVFL